MFNLSNLRSELKVVDDQIGCPTSVKDISRAIFHIIMKKNPTWGTYHFCGKEVTTWYRFASEIFSIFSGYGIIVPSIKPILSKNYPEAANRPLYSVLDCQLIEKNFDIYQPSWKIPLLETINELIKK